VALAGGLDQRWAEALRVSSDASRSSRREGTRPISAAGCGLRTAGRVVRWLPEPHRAITWSPRSAPGRRLQRAVNQASLPLGGTFWALAPTSRKPPLPGHRLDQSFSCPRGLEPWDAEHVGRTAACAPPRSRPSSGAGPARRRQLVGATRCPSRTGITIEVARWVREAFLQQQPRPGDASRPRTCWSRSSGRPRRGGRPAPRGRGGRDAGGRAGRSPGPGELARASGYGGDVPARLRSSPGRRRSRPGPGRRRGQAGRRGELVLRAQPGTEPEPVTKAAPEHTRSPSHEAVAVRVVGVEGSSPLVVVRRIADMALARGSHHLGRRARHGRIIELSCDLR